MRTSLLMAAAACVELVLLLNVLWPLPGEEDAWPWVGGLMAFPVAAALVLIHRPENRVGWALGVTAASAGCIFLTGWYAVTFQDGPASAEVEVLASIPAVGQFVGIVALVYLFPTGICVSPRFGRVLQAFFILMVVVGVLFMLSPTPLPATNRPNPLGMLPEWLGPIADNGAAVLLPFAAIGVVSLVYRWRRAGVVERSQLKWFLAGAVFVPSILALVNIVPDEGGSDLINVVGSAAVLAAFWSLPAAIVIAVTRYRLYDIDRVISRGVTYAVLTAGLAGTYFATVVGLQALLRPVSGGSDLAIVLTTLVVAALFLPARRRVQEAVDRRFNRRAYNAARTVGGFSARLREQIDLDTLREELVAVVEETMQPVRASVWLRSTHP